MCVTVCLSGLFSVCNGLAEWRVLCVQMAVSLKGFTCASQAAPLQVRQTGYGELAPLSHPLALLLHSGCRTMHTCSSSLGSSSGACSSPASLTVCLR